MLCVLEVFDVRLLTLLPLYLHDHELKRDRVSTIANMIGGVQLLFLPASWLEDLSDVHRRHDEDASSGTAQL